jgi:hypothetical protein
VLCVSLASNEFLVRGPGDTETSGSFGVDHRSFYCWFTVMEHMFLGSSVTLWLLPPG